MVEKSPDWLGTACAGGFFAFISFSCVPLFYTPDGCLPMRHYTDKYGPGSYSVDSYVAMFDCYGLGSVIAVVAVGAIGGIVFAFLARKQ